MVLIFNALPLRTLGRFSANDPWNANRPTNFLIEEYVMMPQGSQQAVDSSQFAHRIGLRSELDGSRQMLPESLVELWRRGQVPPERIPILAQAIAPRIVKEDYNLILHQDLTKTVVIPLIAVFVVVVAVGLFVTIDGHTMSVPVATGVGFGFSLFVGAIMWVARQSGRARRIDQIKWLLSANAGTVAAVPEGRTKGRVKMFLKLYAMLIGLFLLIGGGAALWFKFRGGLSNDPVVSATTGDIEMPIEVLASQQPTGVSMLVIVPSTGEQVTVKVPPGISEGTRLRLGGKGAPSPKGGRGDLYLKVRVLY